MNDLSITLLKFKSIESMLVYSTTHRWRVWFCRQTANSAQATGWVAVFLASVIVFPSSLPILYTIGYQRWESVWLLLFRWGNNHRNFVLGHVTEVASSASGTGHPRFYLSKGRNILSHFQKEVRSELNRKLPSRWIGSAGRALLPCPPRSPNFTPCDFFLRIYLKETVFKTPLQPILHDLRVRRSHCTSWLWYVTTCMAGDWLQAWSVSGDKRLEQLWCGKRFWLCDTFFEFLFSSIHFFYIWVITCELWASVIGKTICINPVYIICKCVMF